MHPLLAQMYDTGSTTKVASEGDDLDFNNMSAAEFIELAQQGYFEDGEDGEKVADEGDIDLSQLSGRELLELYAAEEEEQEKAASAGLVETMVESGDAEYWDTAGRLMAHAYNDEAVKIASEVDDDVIHVDLDNISADQLLELADQGYEFADDLEKEAGVSDVIARMRSSASKAYGSAKGQASKAYGSAKGQASKAYGSVKAMERRVSRGVGSRLTRREEAKGVLAKFRQPWLDKEFDRRALSLGRHALAGAGLAGAGGLGAVALKRRKNRD